VTVATDENEAEDDLTPEEKKSLQRVESAIKRYFEKRVREGADPEHVAQEAEAFIEISELEVTRGVKPGKA
jgi:ketol-acid reductoisomerase